MCIKLIVKYFFTDFYVCCMGNFRFGLIHFPLAEMFYQGGSSLIRVVLHSGKYSNVLSALNSVCHHTKKKK